MNNQPRYSNDGVTPAKDSYPRRMIGDFDDSANALWSLHEREAKSHDEARIQSLKYDMDGVLIFVRFNPSLILDIDTIVLIRGSPGWFIFSFFDVIHHRQDPRPSGRSSTTNGVL